MKTQNNMQSRLRSLQLGSCTFSYFRACINTHKYGICSVDIVYDEWYIDRPQSKQYLTTHTIDHGMYSRASINCGLALKRGLQHTLRTYSLWAPPLPKYFPPRDLPRSRSIQRMTPSSHYPRLSRERINWALTISPQVAVEE